ncbi:MAG: hypothetical protein A2Z91_03095 [Deltaproteobacteria bacterium GWA2_38_16]|nr:MAG: hypothetical protein A2Z91_03095 [Deltaproteobacteria bacterium GWA2_38_16]OGQ02872.1 MAG: hypothetical protein A3D19_06520 [Deltaproteobacteria bacterium RIFCSPHIGHO2_02_FULL_38_15]OGQ35111.1 MAG: hypothetical protein A3A72_03665 [Deltaproteobacteria bacterium RIFCSPLOWO2_01_FULL_38_9]OGQ61689.1 MAG: hypothetical protein A3G92_05795 [Deltaproteobacteria bacterium RIFCSPLOWO2_12_FULL_38_8]HBQ21718.1 hypothetical protein [Deltaproteobacteria bacterium]
MPKDYKNFFKRLSEPLLLPLLSVVLFQSYIFIFLAPVPLIYGHFRYGRILGFIFLITSLLLMGLLETSPLIPLFFLLFVILIAFVFSEISKKKLPIENLLIRSIGVLLICYTGILFFISKGHPYEYVLNVGNQYVSSLPHILENKNVPANLTQWKESLIELSKNAAPFTARFIQEKLVAYIICGLLLTLWLTIVILKNLHISVTSNDLSQWKAPDHLVWAFIATFLFSELTIPVLTPISKNILTILFVIYFLQGLSIATFYFSYKKYSRIQKSVGYILLSVFPFLTTCFGFFDLWINFRSHMGKPTRKTVWNNSRKEG